MSTVVVLAFATGVFLVFDAATSPTAASRTVRGPSRARLLLAAAGLDGIGPARLAVVCVIVAVTAALAAAAILGSAVIAALAALGAAVAPVAWVRRRAAVGRRARSRAWPDALDLLAGAVRAGETLPGALAVVAERGPAALRPAFRGALADHRVSGDLAGALARLGARVADPAADRVVATLTVASRVGGRDLGRVLRTLGTFLRQDLAVRREIEARQSWTLVAARVAAAAPWLVLVLVASRPEAAEAYDSASGALVLVGGAVVTAVGYRLMIRLARLPEEPRVLDQTGAPS